MNVLVRFLYALVVAAAVVAFVGVTVFTFYQPPQAPKYPSYAPSLSQAEQNKQSAAYERTYTAFRNDKEKPYHRNVSIIVLVAAALLVAGGFYLMRRYEVLAEGLMLGGVGSSVYAIIEASIADNRVLRFVAVLLLLAGVIVLVQRRFLADNRPV